MGMLRTGMLRMLVSALLVAALTGCGPEDLGDGNARDGVPVVVQVTTAPAPVTRVTPVARPPLRRKQVLDEDCPGWAGLTVTIDTMPRSTSSTTCLSEPTQVVPARAEVVRGYGAVMLQGVLDAIRSVPPTLA